MVSDMAESGVPGVAMCELGVPSQEGQGPV